MCFAPNASELPEMADGIRFFPIRNLGARGNTGVIVLLVAWHH